MKSFCFIILIIVLVLGSCDTVNSENSEHAFILNANERIVVLEDSLGKVELLVPDRYDTSASWVDISDCGKPCDKFKYRFQPKNLKIIQESGFYQTGEQTDSIDRLTISYSAEIIYGNTDTSSSKNNFQYNNFLMKLNADNTSPPIIFDTLQKIGNSYFFIAAMEELKPNKSKVVQAATIFRGNEINFRYELRTRQNDSIAKNFIKNSIELIKTIRINKGI